MSERRSAIHSKLARTTGCDRAALDRPSRLERRPSLSLPELGVRRSGGAGVHCRIRQAAAGERLSRRKSGGRRGAAMPAHAFLRLLVRVGLLLSPGCAALESERDVPPHEDASQSRARWANAAFEFLKNLSCDDVVFTSHKECVSLRALRRRDVAVYSAEAVVGGKLQIVLPDEGPVGRASHDGVLAMDPHPDANFGHLVVVFYVDKQTPASTCRRNKGIDAGRDHCMSLALKNRCRNAIESRRRGSDAAAVSDVRRVRKYSKRCEINFLPLVYQSSVVATTMLSEPDSVRIYERSADGAGASPSWPGPHLQQMLTCREDLPEFAPCPVMRPLNASAELVCNPIRDNTRRCETSHDLARTRCRLFESCDQAVLISGGWNRQHSLQRHHDSIVSMYHMLRSNGFHKDTVKVFFADGMAGGIPAADEGEESADVFPASSKLALRSHIKKMCETPHCVDTLVLYLNSPAKSDGSLLLWDVDGDGLADNNERYMVDELLHDLAACTARHVLVIADQSFSGEIAKAVRRSREHSNVVVYASSREHEYSYGNEFTQHWLMFDHARTCTNDAFQQIKPAMIFSTPESGEVPKNGGSSSRVTLFGAPCDVDPPFTPRELRVYYRGCQNVPTEVWVRTYLINSSSSHRGSSSVQATGSGDPAIPVYRPDSLPGSRARK